MALRLMSRKKQPAACSRDSTDTSADLQKPFCRKTRVFEKRGVSVPPDDDAQQDGDQVAVHAEGHHGLPVEQLNIGGSRHTQANLPHGPEQRRKHARLFKRKTGQGPSRIRNRLLPASRAQRRATGVLSKTRSPTASKAKLRPPKPLAVFEKKTTRV